MKDILGDDAFDISEHEIAFLCPLTYCPELTEIVDVYNMERSDGKNVECGLAFIKSVTIVKTFMYDSKTKEKKAGSFVGLNLSVVKRDMTHISVLTPVCSNTDFNKCLEQMPRYIINVKGDRSSVLDEMRQVMEALANTLPNVYTVIR